MCIEKSDQPTRLVILTTTFPRWERDSVPYFVHDVAEGLTEVFDEVIIVAPHYPGASRRELLASGLEVHRVRYWLPEKAQTVFYEARAVEQLRSSMLNKLKGLAYCFRVLIWLLALRPNAQFVMNPRWILPHGLLAVMVAHLFRQSRVVVGVHGADIFSLRSPPAVWLKRLTLRAADAVVVNSELTRDACDALYKRPYHVISSGFDSRVFKAKSPGSRRKSTDETLRLLSVGRLSPEKGVAIIIQACSDLLAKKVPVQLVIAGDGPSRMELETITRSLGLEEVISFVGWLDKKDLCEVYQEADLFVGGSQKMPSGSQEAFGNVYVESMACGTPVIVPESAGASRLVDHGVNGIVVESITRSKLVREIEKFYGDPEWASRLSDEAPKAVQSFSLNHTIARYARVLKTGQET